MNELRLTFSKSKNQRKRKKILTTRSKVQK